MAPRYRNKKTGNVYVVLGQVTNATNAQDGQEMVLYARDEGWARSQKFVRDINEFTEKFEEV